MQKQKVALVLSSGGARGLAHIGVIEGLIANGYEITSVAGTSIGSLVGAFLACDELDRYKKWACELDRLDVFKLIDFTFSVNGFIRGEKVFKSLEEVIPDRSIDDFNIPYAAIATDIMSKKEKVFTSGSMYQAIKASVAIPTVIRPVHFEDQKLIDGGVLNPVPVNRVKRNEGDILVVSNVSSVKPYVRSKPEDKAAKDEEKNYLDKLNAFKNKWAKLLPGNSSAKDKLGYFELLNRSIDLMQDQLATILLEKYEPDILAEISRDACNTFEFYRAEEMIEEGRRSVEEAISTYKSKEEA